MTPEFTRNVWLELTPLRLVAMPVIIALILLIAGQFVGPEMFQRITRTMVAGLLIAWGSRLAADCIANESVERTWDFQRMTRIGPWQMTIGKLFGAPVLVWYGAAFPAVAAFVSGTDLYFLVMIALAGLLTQALAILFSLLVLRLAGIDRRVKVVMGQVLAIAAGTLVLLLTTETVDSVERTADTMWDISGFTVIAWYRFATGDFVSWPDFLMATSLGATAWAIVGCYRLMREQLQCRSIPWVWVLFTLSVAAWAAGFAGRVPQLSELLGFGSPGATRPFTPIALTIGILVVAVLTVAAAFLEPKSTVLLRQFLTWGRSGRLYRALTAMPAWVPTSLLAAGGVVGLALTVAVGPAAEVAWFWQLVTLAAATTLFMLRDIAVIYAFTLRDGRMRNHLSALTALGILYLILPGLLAIWNLYPLLDLFVPVLFTDRPVLAILSPATMAAIAWLILVMRWVRLPTNSEALPLPGRQPPPAASLGSAPAEPGTI